MTMKIPQNRPPPKPFRHISPAEWAWLNKYRRESAYDEYMRVQRERWLWERPHNGTEDGPGRTKR